MSTSTTDELPADEVIDLEPTLHIETAEPWVSERRVFPSTRPRSRDARRRGKPGQLLR